MVTASTTTNRGSAATLAIYRALPDYVNNKASFLENIETLRRECQNYVCGQRPENQVLGIVRELETPMEILIQTLADEKLPSDSRVICHKIYELAGALSALEGIRRPARAETEVYGRKGDHEFAISKLANSIEESLRNDVIPALVEDLQRYIGDPSL